MKHYIEGHVNNAGEPAFDEYIHSIGDLEEHEKDEVIDMLLDHLGLSLYRTNCTKHGNVEFQLRKAD